MNSDKMTCPSCRKKQEVDATVNDAACVRCGCELSTLQEITTLSRQLCQQATEHLTKQGDFNEALKCSELAWTLTKEPNAARLGLVAAIRSQSLTDISKWLRRNK